MVSRRSKEFRTEHGLISSFPGIFYLILATFAGESSFLDSILTPPYSFNEAFFKKTYGFAPGVGGLAYLGLGVGFFLATIFGAKFADQIYKHVRLYSTVRKRSTSN